MQVTAQQLDTFSSKAKALAEEFVQEQLKDPRLVEAQSVIDKATELSKTIDSLIENKQTLDGELATLEAEKQKQGEFLEDLNKRLAIVQQSFDATQKSMNDASEEVRKLEQQATLLRDQIAKNNVALQQQEQENTVKEKTKTDLDLSIEANQKSIDDLTKVLAELQETQRNKLADFDKLYNEKAKAITALETTIQEHTTKIATLLTTIQEHTTSVETLQKTVTDLETAVTDGEAAVADAKNRADKLLSDAQAQVESEQEELEKEKLYIVEANKMIDSKTNIIITGRDRLKAVITDLMVEADDETRGKLKGILLTVERV